MATSMTPEEAAALVRPTDTMALGLGPANPPAMLEALSLREDFEDLEVGGALILGLYELFNRPGVRLRAGFFGPAERFWKAAGARVELIPAGFRRFAPILEAMRPRVMMVNATPPDDEGNVSLSLHYGATMDELQRTAADPDRLLIVETNAQLPRTGHLAAHPNTLHLSQIDVLVSADRPVFELPEAEATDADRAIAELAATLVPEGATLQTGIGAIPSLVATHLADGAGGDYGIHSEMMTDGLMRLHKAGKVSNAAKGVFPGQSITTFALGSTELYEWLDHNQDVAFAPVGLVNDPMVISSNNRFVSINGAIALDLFGQIVADHVDGRQISGVGGHEDFVVGGEFELEDQSLVCLHSTIEVDGELRSRILPVLPEGAVVSTPRHHTGTIVTEHGIAVLSGLTVRERAEALVEVAHPQFRDELSAAAARL
jgi:acyl-CoA hydrolase